MSGVVTIEEVYGRVALRRFVELPLVLHRDEPRFASPVLAYEQWRLDPQRNPFFDHGDAAYFLARCQGHPAGRITAQVRRQGDEGWFGFLVAVDDAAVVASLVDAAQRWLTDAGCTTMTGPVSFTAADEAGVLVEGGDVAGLTGRPWHPPWYAEHLESAGLVGCEDRATWRLASTGPPAPAPAARTPPPHAGRYGDPRLVLEHVAAVPDVSGAMRLGGLRAARAMARELRAARWETCTIVEVGGDARDAVADVQAAAGAAGYRWVIAPWSPDPGLAAETVHRLYRREW